jgi:hypothetical protein
MFLERLTQSRQAAKKHKEDRGSFPRKGRAIAPLIPRGAASTNRKEQVEMSENLVCDKCGQRFDNRQDLQKHRQDCAGKGAPQSGSDRPKTMGAGGQQRSSE